MPLDIYTKESIVTPSDEHVFPCSLGGRVVGREILDKTTNDKLGFGIDARLDEALRSVRIIVDARNCEGEPAHPLAKVPGDDGNDYTIESGGRPKPRPQGKVVVLPGGKGLHLDGVTVSDVGELKQMLRKKYRSLETTLSLDEVVAKVMAQGVDQKVPSPGTQHKLLLWTLEPYRATAKIAFNLLALNDADLALSAGFDQIRNFIWVGDNQQIPVQSAPTTIGENQLGLLDHLALVEISQAGDAIACVTYFGHISLVIYLGRVQDPYPRRWSYRVDQLAGVDRRDHPADLAIAVPSFVEAVIESDEAFRERALEQKDKLAVEAQDIHRNKFIWNLMRPHLERIPHGRGNDEAIRAAIDAAVSNVIDEMTPNLERAGKMVSEVEDEFRNLLLEVFGLGRSAPE